MMDKHGERAQMLGVRVLDAHANTAKCGKVNDRLRRKQKRTEKEKLKLDIKSGAVMRLGL
jgi:hypothetical protein